MKLVVEQHPYLGHGWWWDLRWEEDSIKRRRSGYALTKSGAIWAAKRQAKKLRVVGKRVELDI